jgi:hypothetical protein
MPPPPADGGVDATTPDATIQPMDVPAPCTATVTGVVRFPNGREPVPRALVYTTVGEAPAPRSGECDQCLASGGAIVHTETAVDGSFSLTVGTGMQRLVVEKGLFVRVVELDVTECDATIALEPETTRLPRNPSEGRIPRIAVSTGFYDAMENVLAKLGLASLDSFGWLVPGSEQFDLFEGAGEGIDPTRELATLLRDPVRLATYDVLLINCGSDPEDTFFGGESIIEDAAVLANLRAFVEGGGRLYVTDEAYDYVEHAFPRFLAFEEDGTLHTTPEPEDEAEIGLDMESVAATVHDEALREWLESLGHLSGGTVRITGMLGGWTVIENVDPELTTTWVSGPVEWETRDTFEVMTDTRPLTVTFDLGCGRVLYTSYHTDDSFFGVGGPALTAQELMLAYLLLEIGTCIDDPVLI